MTSVGINQKVQICLEYMYLLNENILSDAEGHRKLKSGQEDNWVITGQ